MSIFLRFGLSLKASKSSVAPYAPAEDVVGHQVVPAGQVLCHTVPEPVVVGITMHGKHCRALRVDTGVGVHGQDDAVGGGDCAANAREVRAGLPLTLSLIQHDLPNGMHLHERPGLHQLCLANRHHSSCPDMAFASGGLLTCRPFSLKSP